MLGIQSLYTQVLFQSDNITNATRKIYTIVQKSNGVLNDYANVYPWGNGNWGKLTNNYFKVDIVHSKNKSRCIGEEMHSTETNELVNNNVEWHKAVYRETTFNLWDKTVFLRNK